MSKRFIKLYEQITSWEWFRHPNTLCLFIYLLLKANFKDSRLDGMIVRRGQLVTSLPRIATDTGLSIQQTRTALSHLISTGEVTDKSNPHYRVITIVKYDDYQSSTDRSTDNQQTTNRQNNRQSTDNLTPSLEYIEGIEEDRRNRKTATQFSPPTRDELAAFLQEIGSGIDPDYFLDYYNARGWEIKPRQKMKDWKATVRNWQRRETGEVKAPAPAATVQAPSAPKKVTAQCYEQRDYSGEDDDAISAFMRRTEGLWK